MGDHEYGTGRKSKTEYKREFKSGLKRANREGDDVVADQKGAGKNPAFQRFKREWRG